MKVLNNDKLVAVSITKSMNEGKRGSLYECARKWWAMNLCKASQADYVLAVYSGEVIGVFKPSRWYVTESGEYEGRIQFDGLEVTNSPYLHKDIRMYRAFLYIGY